MSVTRRITRKGAPYDGEARVVCRTRDGQEIDRPEVRRDTVAAVCVRGVAGAELSVCARRASTTRRGDAAPNRHPNACGCGPRRRERFWWGGRSAVSGADDGADADKAVSCGSSELLYPFRPLDPSRFRAAIQSVQPTVNVV